MCSVCVRMSFSLFLPLFLGGEGEVRTFSGFGGKYILLLVVLILVTVVFGRSMPVV